MTKNHLLNKAADKLQYRFLFFAKRVVQLLSSVGGKPTEKQTIFVAGVQRSGTNMTMNILERSLDTDLYHERDERAFKDYEMRPLDVIHWLVDSSKAPHVVIKALCELQEVGLLLDEFDPAKVIWVVRDYQDVVNSHLALWSGMPDSIRKITEDRNSAGWRGRGMSDETHELVCKLYTPEMTNSSACALFWYLRNILFFEQQLDRDNRVVVVRYESMVTEPQDYLSKVMDFIGIEYSPWLSKNVFASSIRRRPAPDVDPVIQHLCEGLHERFLEQAI